ncbi:MAG: oxidoreductase [Syntrophales bacterium]
MGRNKLFSKIRIGQLELANRIIMAPMAIHLASMVGELTDQTTAFFLERAKGGVGLIMMGATGWARIDAAHPLVPLDKIELYKVTCIDRYKRLVETLKAEGATVGIQLNHRGRQATRSPFNYKPVAPSAIPWSPKVEVPQALTLVEINNLIERYGRAALTAQQIGFDVVEIHAGHGYLISNFLSPDSNRRDDEYGGSIEGRSKFLLQVVEHIRQTVGPEFPVSVRLNGADFRPGGFSIEESCVVSQLLEKAGIDLLSISAGVYGSYPLTIPSFYTKTACFADLSAAIRQKVNIPIAVAGRIPNAAIAEDLLTAGKTDLIAFGRALLADPYLPRKAREDREADTRPCISCNYCIDTYWGGKNMCTTNPAMGRERELNPLPAKSPKNVWIIGAGIAGMEMAWRASLRGHAVSLFDKENRPGGQWILASKPPGKEHYRLLIDYLWKKAAENNVKIYLNNEVKAEDIVREAPDIVVLATGAIQNGDGIQGIAAHDVVLAWDVLNGIFPSGTDCLVIGGGAIGLEVAHLLAVQGKRVTVAEMKDRVGTDMGDTIRWSLLRILKELGVKVATSVEIMAGDGDYLHVREKGLENKWRKFDVYVLAIGSHANNQLAGNLNGFKGKVYLIGDAHQCQRGADALREAAEIGNEI